MKILHLAPTLFLGGLAVVLAAGCLSRNILEERADHQPARDPKVELRLKSTKPADVLALHDDEDRPTGKATRRAFYLFANEERALAGKQPVFVEPGRIESGVAIPIFNEPPANTNSIPGGLYAISSSLVLLESGRRGSSRPPFRLVAWAVVRYCEAMKLLERITVEPGKCGGQPCIRGKRMRVTDMLDLLSQGASHGEILADYSFLEPEDILAAIAYASRLTDHVVLTSA